MEENLEVQIRKLQEHYWSDSDPEGRGFVPLADLYRRTGDLSEARRLLKDGLARHGSMASGHLVLGWVFLDQGNLVEAEACFRAALAVDSGNIGALKGLGNLLFQRGEAKEAVRVHQALFLLDPLDLDVPERLGELQARAEALEQVQEVPAGEEGVAEEGEAVWEDMEGAAEALDWESAALQEDRSTTAEAPPEAAEPVAEEVEVLSGEEEASQEEVEALPPEAEAVSGEFEEGPSLPGMPDQASPDALVTRTMGEIYLRQGLLQEARGVFAVLLERNPEDESLEARLQEVEERMGLRPVEAGTGTEVEAEAPVEEPTVLEGAPAEVEAEAELEVAPIVPIGDLAPDLIIPVGDLAPDAVEEPASEAAIEAAWEEESFVDAVPVAELAPEAEEEAISPEGLEVPWEEESFVDAVPVAELAPEEIVPISELIPDHVVPVAELAPDLILPIADLAPDLIVPVGALAPDEPPEDPTLDAFEAWLDNLR